MPKEVSVEWKGLSRHVVITERARVCSQGEVQWHGYSVAVKSIVIVSGILS